MSISMIRGQNARRVVDAGVELSSTAAGLDDVIGGQVRAINQMNESWNGSAANTAIAAAYRNVQQQYLEHQKLAALAAAMESGGEDLDGLRTVLLTWVDCAVAMFDVSDAGVVSPRPPNDTAAVGVHRGHLHEDHPATYRSLPDDGRNRRGRYRSDQLRMAAGK